MVSRPGTGRRRAAGAMRLTLIESDRRFLQTAECAMLSVVAHAAVLWCAVGLTAGGRTLPTTEREARAMFLLPPDRVDAPSRQARIVQWGRLGTDADDGRHTTRPDEGYLLRDVARSRRDVSPRSGARGQLPAGPEVPLADTAFSVLQVDSMVHRYEDSAAPIYPPELLAKGVEGVVYAQFVVDTTGRVDTAAVRILSSADPAFTASVREALGQMRFRPAIRGGRKVRQLVEQRFRFTITPPPQIADKRVG